MKKVAPELEAKIQKAAEEGRIVFAPRDLVKQYQSEVDELLDKVFGIRGAWVSNESAMSDFSHKWVTAVKRHFKVDCTPFLTPDKDALVVDVAKAIHDKRKQ